MAPKARRRVAERTRGRRASRGASGWDAVARFFSSPILYRAIVVIVLAYGVYWLVPQAVPLGESVALAVFSALGFGIFIAAIAVGAVVWLVWRGFSPFLHHWNRWLGVGAFLAAAWAILAFFYPPTGPLAPVSLGGQVGQAIRGPFGAPGVLRIALLLFLGFLLATPRGTFRSIAAAVRGCVAAGRGVCSLAGRLRPSREGLPGRTETADLGYGPTPGPAGPGVVPEPAAGLAQTTLERAPAGGQPGAGEPPHPEGVGGQIEKMWQRLANKTVLTPSGWQLPPLSILDKGSDKVLGQADNSKRARAIEEALASYGVEARVVETNVGPAVTQFGVEPGWDRKVKEVKERDEDGNVTVRQEEVARTRVKVERIASLANDLALALAADTIRIEAPVPGKSVVGIEVPNTITGVVTLRSVVETAAFQKLKGRSNLAIGLGKAAGGESVAGDLAKMPHLLIAGATGSGKTVCLNAVIACLLLHNTPENVQFIMVDPKRVEMVAFNTIPHLVAPVVVDVEKAVNVLRWLLAEMDRRYLQFAQVAARNIDDFNKKRPADPMPYLVLVIDELADLMMTASDEVERSLCRLAQLARATGIHLVVATQRPSVDVVTGLIKANFPTRISFAVTSQVDSRTILDIGGAEKLLGKGDMLYMPTDASKPRRVQGCYVSDQEIERLVYFWNSQKGPDVPLRVQEFSAAPGVGGEHRPEDPLLGAARRLAQEHRHISASFLQRRLHIGYARAAQLMDLLDQEREEEREEAGSDSGRLQ